MQSLEYSEIDILLPLIEIMLDLARISTNSSLKHLIPLWFSIISSRLPYMVIYGIPNTISFLAILVAKQLRQFMFLPMLLRLSKPMLGRIASLLTSPASVMPLAKRLLGLRIGIKPKQSSMVLVSPIRWRFFMELDPKR